MLQSLRTIEMMQIVTSNYDVIYCMSYRQVTCKINRKAFTDPHLKNIAGPLDHSLLTDGLICMIDHSLLTGSSVDVN